MAIGAKAAEFNPPSTTKSDIVGGKYVLDKSHANIFFSVSHLGFSNYFGKFTDFDAILIVNPKRPKTSNIEVVINTESADSGNEKLNEKYKSKDFFDVAKFPKAVFKSTELDIKTDTTAVLTGNLTLLGTTKPVKLDVTFNGTALNPYAKKNALGFSAKGKFKRSDFGMNMYTPSVSDEVNLIIEAEFTLDEELDFSGNKK